MKVASASIGSSISLLDGRVMVIAMAGHGGVVRRPESEGGGDIRPRTRGGKLDYI